MRNYQVRKANNEVTVKKKFLGGGANNKCLCVCGEEVGTVYMYIRLCSLGFDVTLLIFQSSKKNSPKMKIKKIKKIKIKN